MLTKKQTLDTIKKTLSLYKTNVLDNVYAKTEYVDSKALPIILINDENKTGSALFPLLPEHNLVFIAGDAQIPDSNGDITTIYGLCYSDLQNDGSKLITEYRTGKAAKVNSSGILESFEYVDMNVKSIVSNMKGGEANKVLAKNSDTDFDYKWVDMPSIETLPVDYDKNCATNVAELKAHTIYVAPKDANFLYLGYEKLSGSFSGFFLSGNPHGKFIYTGYKDDSRIEVMIEGTCYTAYFKTDTEDAHTEKTVYYLTKNNNIGFTPTLDYEPATKKYVDSFPHMIPLSSLTTTNESNQRILDVSKLTKSNYLIYDDTITQACSGSFVYIVDNSTTVDDTMTILTRSSNPIWTLEYRSNTKLLWYSNGYEYWKFDLANNIQTNATLDIKTNFNKYISKTNTTEYTPTEDYHPATKKYVDDVSTEATDEEVNAMLLEVLGGDFTDVQS